MAKATPQWITTAEAVKISGYTSYHVRYLLNSGKIKGQKFGEVWQIDRASLLDYIDKVKDMGAKRGRKTHD
jgi:hypothetical protein